MRAAVAVATLAAGLTLAAGGGSAPSPGRLQVSASEFRLALSRPALRQGAAVVELVNGGEDDHDLVLRRVGTTRVARIGIVHPGDHRDLALRLRPGRYVLWCTLPGHRARGMTASLRVR
jgi:hypothetical protein